MKWIDAAKVDAERADAQAPGEKHEPILGVCYRPDDGTRFGRWRVACRSPDERTRWSVWDLRRVRVAADVGGPREIPTPVRVGLPAFRSPQTAILVAEILDRSVVLRAGVALVRGLAEAALGMAEEIETSRRIAGISARR